MARNTGSPAGGPADLTVERPLAFQSARKRLRVLREGAVLADSAQALVVHELGHTPVFYFPRSDVSLARFSRVARATHCPRKGDASYFAVGGADGPVIAWSYEAPISAAAALKDHIAFYPDQIELTEEA